MRSTTLGTLLLSVSIVLAFVGLLDSNLSWTVVAVAIASVYVYSWRRFVSELESTTVQVERNILDEMAYSKEPVSVTVEVLNRNPFAIRGTFEDVLPEDWQLYAGSNRSTRALPPRTMLKLSYSAVPARRGTHTFPGMKITRTDELELFEDEQFAERRSEVNVHTQKGVFDAARKMAGREHLEFSGMGRNPAIVLREFEFDGIREYVPGDKARDIQWKLLPKTGRLMTKTYKKEGAVQTMIFVDCARSMRLEKQRVAKIDHAVDITMQLSNVLLSSFHPAGVALFDEVNVLSKVQPGLGRHQFEKIVKTLRDVPKAQRTDQAQTSPPEAAEPEMPSPRSGAVSLKGSESGDFLSTIGSMRTTGAKGKLGIGLEGGMKEILSRNRNQEHLFIILSDLVSSRDAVLVGAKICQSTNNRMLVINTYDDWYGPDGQALDVPRMERLYDGLSDSLRLEGALRSLGALYLRIGPSDTAPRIVRAIRRGNA